MQEQVVKWKKKTYWHILYSLNTIKNKLNKYFQSLFQTINTSKQNSTFYNSTCFKKDTPTDLHLFSSTSEETIHPYLHLHIYTFICTSISTSRNNKTNDKILLKYIKN